MKKYFILIFLIASKISIAQCDDISFNNKSFPQICVENTIKWLNSSRSNWKEQMGKYDFSSTGFNESGVPYYSSGTELNDDGILYVIAKDFGNIEIMNFPINKWDYKRDIFKNIVEQLEPFFLERKGNWAYFQFRYIDKKVYLFALNQSSKMDLLILTKK